MGRHLPIRMGLVLLIFGILGLCIYARAQEPITNAAAEPATESPLAIEPQTPREFFRAAELMVDLGLNDLAKDYLARLVSSQPTDEELLEIRDRFGIATVLRFANTNSLNPAAGDLLKAVNAASQRKANDPNRIDRLVSELAGSPRERDLALVELRNSGLVAVPRLVQRLGTETDKKTKDTIAFAILRMGRQVIPALRGGLGTDNNLLKADLIGLLGRLKANEAESELEYFAFSEGEPTAVQIAAREAVSRIQYGTALKWKQIDASGMSRRLYDDALSYFEKGWRRDLDDDGMATIWLWDEAQQTVLPNRLSPEAASMLLARLQGHRALAVKRNDSSYQSLFLAVLMAEAQEEAGLGQPIPTGPGTAHDLALSSGIDVVEQAILLSINTGRTSSLLPLVDVFAELAGEQQMTRSRTTQKLLNYPNARVQFATAEAILRTRPHKSFRDSSRVTQILVHALNDDGKPSAVVIDPNGERNSRTAGHLSDLGFVPHMTETGQEGFTVAAERGDVGLVLIHVNSIRWELSQTIANFKADARTMALPIAIYGSELVRAKYSKLVERTPRTTFLTESRDVDNFLSQLRPFVESLDLKPLTTSERVARRQAAADWLSKIADEGTASLFALHTAEEALVQAANDPGLYSTCLHALGAVPTVSAQERLASMVLAPAHSEDEKAVAARELRKNIQEFSLTLPRDTIENLRALRQTASNQSLQTALAGLFGTLKPDAALVSDRMLQFPPLPAKP